MALLKLSLSTGLYSKLLLFFLHPPNYLWLPAPHKLMKCAWYRVKIHSSLYTLGLYFLSKTISSSHNWNILQIVKKNSTFHQSIIPTINSPKMPFIKQKFDILFRFWITQIYKF
jgi:hypothetical protein